MAPTNKRNRLASTSESQRPSSERAKQEDVDALDTAKRAVACSTAREKAARAALDSCEEALEGCKRALASLQVARERAQIEFKVASEGRREADIILAKMETQRNVINVDDQHFPSCRLLKTFVHGDAAQVTQVCLLGNSSFVSYGKGPVKVWDISSGLCTQTLSCGGGDFAHTVAPMANDDILVGTSNGKMALWNSVTGTQLRTYEEHNGPIYSIAVVDKDTFISASFDKRIRLWSVSTGECIRSSKEKPGLNCVAIIGINRILAGYTKGKIEVWNISDDTCIWTYTAHEGHVFDLATADDETFVSASRDATIKLWQTSRDECLRTFVGHSAPVISVAVVDRNRFISGSADMTIKLWCLTRNSCICTYMNQSSTVWSLSVVGKDRILSGDQEGKINLLEFA